MPSFDYIKRNYLELTEEIEKLSHKAAGKVTLVSVTKSGSDEELLALASFGATDIGENRPGELNRRGELLRANGFCPNLHEIGNLQRNKVKYIINTVSLIHSVDSAELAREIDRRAAAIGRRINVLVEINSAMEAAKGGVMPEDAFSLAEEILGMKSLALSGVMTMGPVCENPEDIRPYFRKTKELFDKIGERYGYEGDGILSMGMSDSYGVAIEEGSTLVRVGRRLFTK